MRFILLFSIIMAFVSSASAQEFSAGVISSKVNLVFLEGRSYYLVEPGYTCRANAPRRPWIKSWRNKIQFRDGKVYAFGDRCNDAPFVTDLDPSKFHFSLDLSTMIHNSQVYRYYTDRPVFD